MYSRNLVLIFFKSSGISSSFKPCEFLIFDGFLSKLITPYSTLGETSKLPTCKKVVKIKDILIILKVKESSKP